MCYSAKKAVEIKMSFCILMTRTCTKDTILLKSLSSFFLFSKRAQNTCYLANMAVNYKTERKMSLFS